MKKKSKEVVDLSIDLYQNDQYHEAICLLKEHLPNLRKDNFRALSIIHCHLGYNYLKIEHFDIALVHFDISLSHVIDNELASIGKYIVLIDLDKSDDAIAEMLRFLKGHEADLYKTTIEELLEGLEEGYMTDYEVEIREFAEKYDISIAPGEAIS